MTNADNGILDGAARGATVEADGNAGPGSAYAANGAPLLGDARGAASGGANGAAGAARGNGLPAGAGEDEAPTELGPNNELLEQVSPRLVNALRELAVQFRQEGIVARRHEIRRIRQARLFWQGLQYAWWNPQDMNWHLPSESQIYDDSALEEMPRYQFVTNLYQAFGLSFVSVLSQDVPATRFYPQSTLNEADITTAKAASEVAGLIEQNNRAQQLLTGVGFYLWTDGKIGGYVRYVADGQRFGWRDELVMEERWVRLGSDAYECPKCGAETEIGEAAGEDAEAPGTTEPTGGYEAWGTHRNSSGTQPLLPRARPLPGASRSKTRYAPQNDNEFPGTGADGMPGGIPPANSAVRNDGREHSAVAPQNERASSSRAGDARQGGSFFGGAMCGQCGGVLGEKDFRPAPLVPVPLTIGTRRVPNGQEVISIVGGLELNTPVWANEQHEFPYLQWQMEVHRAKLKAAYPHAADKIQMGGAQSADEVYARATRIAVSQGMPTMLPGDALFNLVTFSRTWIRPWAFYSIEDASVRDALLQMFPDGCYVAFAGDTYCESRNESMDDCWRVMHALPGDGQNRPSVGDSLIQIQERYNTLSNIQAETYEYGIPPIYADPQVLDFDALQSQTAEPAAHYPARARPGMTLADGFFQPAPAQVPPDMLRHQQDLIGPIAQFLTGLFPAVFGGEMENVKTASGYAMARDQALGRLGLVWRRLKQFYGELLLLSVDCFRKNRPSDVEMPFLGAGGEFEAKFIRLADLKGNIQAHAESDETFPRLKSQQRAVLQQLMANPDPTIQAALREPANLGFIKSLIGLSELVVPGEDARNKQLREVQQLLMSAPIVVKTPGAVMGRETPTVDDGSMMGHAEAATDVQVISTVPVDELFDDHATEFEECRRWASSDAGQVARAQNPAGFANVRAHAAQHAALIAMQQVSASAGGKGSRESTVKS